MGKKIKNKKIILVEDRQVEILAKEDRIIHDGLKEVYSDGDGQMPDLSKIEQRQTSWWHSVLTYSVVILVVLTVASWLLFFWWSDSSQKFSGKNVSVKIEGPLSVVSGQPATYYVNLANDEKVDIYSLNLELSFPTTFTFASSTPQPFSVQNNLWKFSVLAGGDRQRIEIKGVSWADKNSLQSFKATLRFRPANFNADFKEEGLLEIPVSSAVVGLAVTGPAKTLAEQKINYSIKYKNNSPEDLADLQLVLNYPAALIVDKSSVEPEKDQNNLWLISKLKSGEEKELKLSGHFDPSKITSNQELKAQIKIKGAQDNYYILEEQLLTTEVVKDQLTLNVIINGSAQDQPINFGDTLNYSVVYKNEGQQTVGDLKIAVTLNSQILDWSTLKDSNQGQISNNTITWTSQEIKNLNSLSSDQDGSIDFSIKVKDRSVINDSKVTSFRVESGAVASFNRLGDTETAAEITAKPLVNEINSDVSLGVDGRYFNDDNIAVGTGPLPPKVGETTTYQINWKINNSLHELSDIKIVSTLPNGVSWANRTNLEAGSIAYSAADRQVIWSVNRLPKTVTQLTSSFNVSITPTAEQKGKLLILVPESTLQAIDKQTCAKITLTAETITTDLANDPVAKGKGIVE